MYLRDALEKDVGHEPIQGGWIYMPNVNWFGHVLPFSVEELISEAPGTSEI